MQELTRESSCNFGPGVSNPRFADRVRPPIEIHPAWGNYPQKVRTVCGFQDSFAWWFLPKNCGDANFLRFLETLAEKLARKSQIHVLSKISKK